MSFASYGQDKIPCSSCCNLSRSSGGRSAARLLLVSGSGRLSAASCRSVHWRPGTVGHNSGHSSLLVVSAGACPGGKPAGSDQELALKCRSRTRTEILLTTAFQLGLRSCWWTMIRCASGSSVRCSNAANTKVKASDLQYAYLPSSFS